MAIKNHNSFVKLASLLSLVLYFLIIAMLNPRLVLTEKIVEEEEDPEFYILDETSPVLSNLLKSSKNRVLVSHYKKIRKGMRCNIAGNNICNGVWANNGTSLLHCCKKHCRNILGDQNNCGQCGQKCSFGQRCCGGVCTYVGFDPNHCGKCNKKCAAGVKCEYGYCGYA